MKLQRLYSLTRQAVDRYGMIQAGDRIAVGVSGGKDSLALLVALKGLSGFYPKKFQVFAVTVDLGFRDFDSEAISRFCESQGISCQVIPTRIAEILFKGRGEAPPCSLCAKMRKGALNQMAKEMGCSKVAYAHHMDDLIETMLMSLIYEGRFYTFPPYMYFEDTQLAVIRPMMLVPEADVVGFQRRYQLPVCKNPCPSDGHTRREYVKQLIRRLEHENPGMKKRLFHAILEGRIPGWPSM